MILFLMTAFHLTVESITLSTIHRCYFISACLHAWEQAFRAGLACQLITMTINWIITHAQKRRKSQDIHTSIKDKGSPFFLQFV